MPTPSRACTSRPIWKAAHLRNPSHRSISNLEATGMVLRLDTHARRIDTGRHRVFAVTPGTQAEKTSGRDVVTWLRDLPAQQPSG